MPPLRPHSSFLSRRTWQRLLLFWQHSSPPGSRMCTYIKSTTRAVNSPKTVMVGYLWHEKIKARAQKRNDNEQGSKQASNGTQKEMQRENRSHAGAWCRWWAIRPHQPRNHKSQLPVDRLTRDLIWLSSPPPMSAWLGSGVIRVLVDRARKKQFGIWMNCRGDGPVGFKVGCNFKWYPSHVNFTFVWKRVCAHFR